MQGKPSDERGTSAREVATISEADAVRQVRTALRRLLAAMPDDVDRWHREHYEHLIWQLDQDYAPGWVEERREQKKRDTALARAAEARSEREREWRALPKHERERYVLELLGDTSATVSELWRATYLGSDITDLEALPQLPYQIGPEKVQNLLNGLLEAGLVTRELRNPPHVNHGYLWTRTDHAVLRGPIADLDDLIREEA